MLCRRQALCRIPHRDALVVEHRLRAVTERSHAQNQDGQRDSWHCPIVHAPTRGGESAPGYPRGLAMTILLLFGSNVFMTIAWYGHLKYGHAWPLWKVILISWGIA